MKIDLEKEELQEIIDTLKKYIIYVESSQKIEALITKLNEHDADLSRIYEVTHQNICDIVNRKSWRHI